MSPKEITIPFQPNFQHKMLLSIKTCTSRTKKYGDIGDWFRQFGSIFVIISIKGLRLEYVANTLYREEGCDSPDEFIKIWLELHPRRGWVPKQKVFTHFFEKEG